MHPAPVQALEKVLLHAPLSSSPCSKSSSWAEASCQPEWASSFWLAAPEPDRRQPCATFCSPLLSQRLCFPFPLPGVSDLRSSCVLAALAFGLSCRCSMLTWVLTFQAFAPCGP